MRWPRRLDRRIGLLIVGLAFTLAVVGSGVSFLLTRAVLRSSLDEQLATISGHDHTSVSDLAEEVPPRSVIIWRAHGRDTMRTVGGSKRVAPADRAVLERLLDRGPGPVRGVKLPVRDDVRVSVTDESSHRELVALTAEPMERDLARLAAWQITLWSVGGFLAAVTGIAVTGRVTRPLRDVAATASGIAAEPVDSVTEAVSRRVTDRHSTVTEVDAVVHSMNALLGQVESAMVRRDESEEALRAFLADVSHELRTPVAVMRSHAELSRRLVTRHLDEEPRPLGSGDAALAARHQLVPSLERIERESERMGRLVDDLLLLARTDGTKRPEDESVDLTFVALEVLSDAKMLSRDHVWSFEAPEEPIEVAGDADGVRRVVTNLVTNARKHTPAGTHVDVAVGQTEDGVWLRVRDDGPGLPRHVAEAPGQRFVGRNPNDPTSTGLGLAITRSLVEAMNGTITVDSTADGTDVFVTLRR